MKVYVVTDGNEESYFSDEQAAEACAQELAAVFGISVEEIEVEEIDLDDLLDRGTVDPEWCDDPIRGELSRRGLA